MFAFLSANIADVLFVVAVVCGYISLASFMWLATRHCFRWWDKEEKRAAIIGGLKVDMRKRARQEEEAAAKELAALNADLVRKNQELMSNFKKGWM